MLHMHTLTGAYACTVGASFASSASPSAFPALSQSPAISQPFSVGFGGTPTTAAPAPFGQSSSSSPLWPTAPSASGMASGFGSFGLGQSPAPASGPAASPFGKGLSFGTPSSSSSAAAAAPTASSGGFGAFGNPAASAGFGESQASGVVPS